MKLDSKEYKNALKNLHVSPEANQKILQKNKDTEFEKWLVKREQREDCGKRIFWTILMTVMLLLSVGGLGKTIYLRYEQYQLEVHGKYVVGKYDKIYKAYRYDFSDFTEKRIEKVYAVDQWKKSILYKNDGDTQKLYYMEQEYGRKTVASPLFQEWVWITAYLFWMGLILIGGGVIYHWQIIKRRKHYQGKKQ